MRDLENFKKQVVLVAGDMMVDKYIMGSVDRISPEAPVPVLKKNEVRRKLGGAGNVIMNLTNLGAKVRALGRIGVDDEGSFFCDELRKCGVDDRFISREGSTIVKTRVSANGQQFIRIDEEVIREPSAEVLEKISVCVDDIFYGVTVVIISDYAKGFVTEKVCQLLIKTAKRYNIPILVDPKGDCANKYEGATAVTPNQKEFADLTRMPTTVNEEWIKEAGLKLCKAHRWEYVICTRSEKGISVICNDTQQKTDYPAVSQEVVDVTGAGDTVVSTIALAMASEFTLDECVKVGIAAASIVIARFGAAQTTIEELKQVLCPYSNAGWDKNATISYLHSLQKAGKRIVFTNGCFDLLHAGHISSLRQARSLGDILVVGLNSDNSIKRLKGLGRPIVDIKNRLQLLASINCVDFVIPFEEDTPQNLIEQVRPDILVKGKDWEGKGIAGEEFVRSYGGTVAYLEMEQGLSTTSIIQKIQKMLG